MYENKEQIFRMNPGFNIIADFENMNFIYGQNTFGPKVEQRKLDSIRLSLMDPNCTGPDTVYAIAMDVGKLKDQNDLKRRNLLFGTVIYAKGKLGKEPIRSQGHTHAISQSCGESTPEVYEIWSGKAIIYMQESSKKNCGRCFAVEGNPGDIIVVPPGWAHATISADPNLPLTFGAWCVRDYGFEYKDVRENKGLAYYPILEEDSLKWISNPSYNPISFVVKQPREYSELQIERFVPIYHQYEMDNERFAFVSKPSIIKNIWENFTP